MDKDQKPDIGTSIAIVLLLIVGLLNLIIWGFGL